MTQIKTPVKMPLHAAQTIENDMRDALNMPGIQVIDYMTRVNKWRIVDDEDN